MERQQGFRRVCPPADRETVRGTFYWRVDPQDPDPAVIAAAAAVIRRGGLVAFPTETVYGLGADATNGAAVRRIFAAKGRPADNPLIVHISAMDELRPLVRDVPDVARALAGAFWPGPLTLVLPAAPSLPREVTAGLDTVGVRMPDHPVALALIRAAGVPLAAPSANASGRPSPTTAAHVLDDLGGRIDAVLDGGPAPVGVESTVLDLTATPPAVLRPGGVTVEQLEAVLGRAAVADRKGENGGPPRSPGMKYRHYAPRTPLVLFEGPPPAVAEAIRRRAAEARAAGRRAVVLAAPETAGLYAPEPVVVTGPRDRPDKVAAALYDALRRADAAGADVILAEGPAPGGLGGTVLERLRRAATEIVLSKGPGP
ncbi:MAG: L-threonylcarbamoyladenylate synthase [Thermoanaerobacterales bacterium]|nr:L-threonylcarbamoyladenylate synthase [Bacillota bacterium]MDI6906377.1 L-threonylcarbamoyladenylate synthase [Thermoanaerobacterales bacterium]